MTMTYNGSTAGSTLANPPVLLAAAMGGVVNWVTSGSTADPMTYGRGAKLWFWSSTNASTDITATGFNDGVALGMKPGDVLIAVLSSAGSTAPITYMGALASSAGSTSFVYSSSVMSSTMA